MNTASRIFLVLVLVLVALAGGCGSSQPAPASAPASVELLPADHVLSPAAARALLDGEDAHITLVDLRTPDEYAAGHVEGATNVDYNAPEFETNLAALPRDGQYVVYCRTGRRSGASLPVFERLGFRHYALIDGGLTAWSAAGYPVTSPPPSPTPPAP